MARANESEGRKEKMWARTSKGRLLHIVGNLKSESTVLKKDKFLRK